MDELGTLLTQALHTVVALLFVLQFWYATEVIIGVWIANVFAEFIFLVAPNRRVRNEFAVSALEFFDVALILIISLSFRTSV